MSLDIPKLGGILHDTLEQKGDIMEEWKTLIVEKLKCIKGLVSKPEENQKAIKKNFEDIARQIHKSFPQFWGNLCQIMLDRKKLIIDSGLKKRAERVMKEIEVENPGITYKRPGKIGYDLKLSETDSLQYVHSFLDEMFRKKINFADRFCAEVKEGDSDKAKCQKIFGAWIGFMISNYNEGNVSDVNLMLDQCEVFNTELDERLEDNEIREYELKNILACYSYFHSKPTWPTKIKQVVKYLKEEYKNDKSYQYWQEIDEIMRILDSSGNMAEACEDLKNRSFLHVQSPARSIECLQNFYSRFIERGRQRFSEAQRKGYEIDQKFIILMRYYYAEKIQEPELLDLILRNTVFEFLLKAPCLSASNPNIKSVLEYFLGSLKLFLEVDCYQSAFGRTAYALRDWEVIEVALDKLKIGKGDKFLDMFSNIPVISYCASLLGAEVHYLDCDFIEADRFTSYYWAEQEDRRRFASSLLDAFKDPDKVLEAISNIQFEILNPRMPSYPPPGGPFMPGGINPRAIERFLGSPFSRIIKNNPICPLKHEFSTEEIFKDEDKIRDFADNYFDKAIMDPPYGKKTAQEGFGPEQGLIIASKGLKEASRILKQGGNLVVTLPSYKSRWEKFKKMRWREEALNFAKECGFEQIDKDLPTGRALILLRKQ